MSVHRIPIIGFSSIPDASGNVWPEPATIKQTTAPWRGLQYIFKDTSTKDGLHGRFMVPKNFVGTAKLCLVWAVNATTGNARWVFEYRAIADTESFNQAGNQESVGATVACPATAHLSKETLITLTSTNFAVGDVVDFAIFRDGAAAGPLDTVAADVALRGAWFEYADV